MTTVQCKFSVTGRLLFPHTQKPDNAGKYVTNLYKIQVNPDEAGSVTFLRLIEEYWRIRLPHIANPLIPYHEEREGMPQLGLIFRCQTTEQFPVIDEYNQPFTTEVRHNSYGTVEGFLYAWQDPKIADRGGI